MKAFNGDRLLAEAVLRLRDEYNPEIVIETGTFEGDTTEWLAENFKNVLSVEVNADYYHRAIKRLASKQNVCLAFSDSGSFLKSYMPNPRGRALLFLDAHWYAHCPLLEEISAVRSALLPPVIVIHDFYVPGSDLGFDTWNGQRLDLEWISPTLDAAYGPGKWRHDYNSEAEGARRGAIFIEPV